MLNIIFIKFDHDHYFNNYKKYTRYLKIKVILFLTKLKYILDFIFYTLYFRLYIFHFIF
jgi:hypothetical protein